MSALTAKSYTHHFGSLGFFWLGDGDRTAPLIGRKARNQIDPIHYGNGKVIQKSGYDDAPIQHVAVIKSADLAAWRNAVNSTASLTITGESAVTAYLDTFGDPKLYPDDANALMVTLVFIL